MYCGSVMQAVGTAKVQLAWSLRRMALEVGSAGEAHLAEATLHQPSIQTKLSQKFPYPLALTLTPQLMEKMKESVPVRYPNFRISDEELHEAPVAAGASSFLIYGA